MCRPSGRREEEPPTRRTILVVGLGSLGLDKEDVEQAFGGELGRVEDIEMSRDLATLTFRRRRDALDAVERYNGGKLNDQVIEVRLAGDLPAVPPSSEARPGVGPAEGKEKRRSRSKRRRA